MQEKMETGNRRPKTGRKENAEGGEDIDERGSQEDILFAVCRLLSAVDS